MTTPVTWPIGLPQRPNAGDFGIEHQLNSDLFRPDNGVSRGRRVAESLPDNRTLSFDLKRAQYADFETFWSNDLKGGFLPIRFVDPVTGGALDLLPTAAVEVQRLGPQVWRITFKGEVL